MFPLTDMHSLFPGSTYLFLRHSGFKSAGVPKSGVRRGEDPGPVWHAVRMRCGVVLHEIFFESERLSWIPAR